MMDERTTDTAGEDRIIAFLFTDIEGSTGHAQRFPEGMRSAHARHDEILRKAAETFGGDLFASVGDGFKAAFPDPTAAVRAAFEAQRALQTVFIDDGGTILLRVRMAIHAGMTQERQGEYVGLTPAKASRLVETIHGGQIVLTGGTAEIVRPHLPDGAALQDIGEFRLRDFETPDRLFQIAHPDLPANFPPLRPTDAVPNNLPYQLSHLIGRETETEDIRQRVVTYPLVTLTGAGGCGKTRLALHVADRFLRKFRHGVWFIDLTHSDDGESIARTTADVLGVKPDADSPLTQQLISHLASLRCLLILDNCEHVIDAAAGFAAELLKSCKDVRILATSREALGVGGEALYPVHPLPFPPEELRDPKAMMTFDSVRQFALQARLKSPTFTLTKENVFAVARICRTLEGIPLGVYLMASWSDTLTPAQMDAQMAKRFKFPKAAPGERTLPARHLTVRATIEYSLDLLTESERALLRRLAIFSGGFTLEAAEEICGGDPVEDVLESLTRLLRKSLLETEDTPFGKRYRLLQPIREFALELLHERGEHDALRARHCDYFVRYAETLKPRLLCPQMPEALQATDAEIDNFHTVLNSSQNITMGLRLLTSLFWYWRVRGFIREGLQWAERFLPNGDAFTDDDRLRAEAYNAVGHLRWAAGTLDDAHISFLKALNLFRTLNDTENTAKSLVNLGSMLGELGKFDVSAASFEESATLYRQIGNETRAAHAIGNLGVMLERQGDRAGAKQCYDNALKAYFSLGDDLNASAFLVNSAAVALEMGMSSEALESLQRSLKIRAALNYHSGISETVEAIAEVANAKGELETAASLLAAASTLRERSQTARSQKSEENAAGMIGVLQGKMSRERYAEHCGAGNQWSVEDILRATEKLALKI